ncbi:carbohydrate kinase family protein [Marinobacter sp. NP-4(2019)]|uniref:carbohydrate kinase family protein n=1 Tax=Marinobacter sp. NP-4(2019) TaxID=2488665 RepID=UPI000FC3CD24|nr:carbohydrate kinase family protein [Marinobacter sp. NP-4(2019)]AZT84834.1 carbohydrate kinase family protein [Marinobacter sp. NP-4(2019)]
MKPVFVVGGASLDTIVHVDAFPGAYAQTVWPNRSYRAVGSTGVGKALNLRALEVPVVLHAVVGNDQEGRMIRQTLEQAGVEALISETPEPTEQHVNLMTPAGERLSIFVQPPAREVTLEWSSIRRTLRGCGIAVINILDYTRPILEEAVSLGVPIWTDLHDYDGSNDHHQAFIDAADVVFLASDNLPNYRQVMERLLQQGKRLVVCTHGAAGATLANAEGEWLEQPAYPVDRIEDSNGAGDAFFSGFLYGYLRGLPERDCLQLAAASGALCVTSSGLASEHASRSALQDIVSAK